MTIGNVLVKETNDKAVDKKEIFKKCKGVREGKVIGQCTHGFCGTERGSFRTVTCINADWFSILYSNHHLTTPLLHTLHLCIQNQVLFLCSGKLPSVETGHGNVGKVSRLWAVWQKHHVPCRSKRLPHTPKCLPELQNTLPSYLMVNGEHLPKQYSSHGMKLTSIYCQDQEFA